MFGYCQFFWIRYVAYQLCIRCVSLTVKVDSLLGVLTFSPRAVSVSQQIFNASCESCCSWCRIVMRRWEASSLSSRHFAFLWICFSKSLARSISPEGYAAVWEHVWSEIMNQYLRQFVSCHERCEQCKSSSYLGRAENRHRDKVYILSPRSS